MIPTALGDRAQLFSGLRQNADIRARLNQLTGEMSSGVAADMVAHLKGDTAPLHELDRRLGLASSYGAAAREVGQRLQAIQAHLGQVEETRARALGQIVVPSQTGDRAVAAMAARAAWEDVAVALNGRWGDGSLFAGTDSGGPALAQGAAMLADLRAAMAGAVDAADVRARLDTWFDDPAGGFRTMAYLGGTTDITRAIDEGATVAVEVRADHPALRGVLKAAALGILAGDATLGLSEDQANKLLDASRDAFLSASLPLTQLRGGLGQQQAFADEAAARHGARESAWGILRNEMTLADPFTTASEIEALRTRLETHYEITGRLQRLNLAQYLR